MNIEQHIFYRNYQHSKEASVYNLNMSILVTIDRVDQLPPDNYCTLQQNGLEIFFLLIDVKCSAFTIQIEKFPFGNWVILSCNPTFLLTSLLKEIEISRNYILLINSIDFLNSIKVEELIMLSSTINQYPNYFISYNRQEAKALLFPKNKIDKIIGYSLSDYSLNDVSIELVKRFLELSGLRDLSIISENRNKNCYHCDVGLCKTSNKTTIELQYTKYQYYEKAAVKNALGETTIINRIYDYRNKQQSFVSLR